MTADMIQQYARDPAKFRSDLYLPTGSGIHRFGDIQANFQVERINAIDPALQAVAKGTTPPFAGFYDERTKGGSKDSDHSMNLLWLLAFSPRSLRIPIGAYDQQQADEVRLIVKSILKIDRPLNQLLNKTIEVQADKIINRRNESICEILTSDKLGSHGNRPDLTLINELTHQNDDGFSATLLVGQRHFARR